MYWTVQQGLWGTAEEGAAAGKKFASAVMPSTVEYLDKVWLSLEEVSLLNLKLSSCGSFERQLLKPYRKFQL